MSRFCDRVVALYASAAVRPVYSNFSNKLELWATEKSRWELVILAHQAIYMAALE